MAIAGDRGTTSEPLVSVATTFLDGDRFIREAIDSVLAQSYANWELLLVDDGSKDSSTAIAREYVERFPDRISILEHEGHVNRGIPASRNLAIRHAKGKYVAFLDADDYWLPDKLKAQVATLESHPGADMLFGLCRYWYSWTGNPDDLRRDFVPDAGVPTGVLYKAPALLTLLYPLGQATAPSMSGLIVSRDLVTRVGGFEEEFRGMYEDQAFLVKAYLHGSVFVSGDCLDKYRIHPDSCQSAAIKAGQYDTVRLSFLKWFESYLNQRNFSDAAVRAALERALHTRRAPDEAIHYGGWIFRVAQRNKASLSIPSDRPDEVRVSIEQCESTACFDIQLNLPRFRLRANQSYEVLFRVRSDQPRRIMVGASMAHDPWSNLGMYRELQLTPEWTSFAEQFVANADEDKARIHFDVGGSLTPVELAGVTLRLPDGTPAPGEVQFGTFRRLEPFSRMWGYDRGQPIDRYYIENFLQRHAGDIRGRVLEIEDNTYTCKFGSTSVTRSDVLHVVEGNPNATIVGDLTCAPQIPSDTFDCIILTQTLQLIYDLRAAVQTLYRILKPGGVLLATCPGITQTNDRDWSNDWYWSFTPLAISRVLQEAFAASNIHVEKSGSVLSAISFLHGLAAEELTRQELDHWDRGYEVILGVTAIKSKGQA